MTHDPARHWLTEVVDNPLLADLPYRIETNRFQEILMSPAKNRHNHLQNLVSQWLHAHGTGVVEIEWSILTSDGVKVPDVVWMTRERFAEHGLETPYTVAPELCVEVLSPSNSRPQMAEKAQLYFGSGALEVWLVAVDGALEVLTAAGITGDARYSALFPTAPARFDLG